MRKKLRIICGIISLTLVSVLPAIALDWEPITDAEKSLRTNPIDPGAGAVVLFKKGNIHVEDRGSFWLSTIVTYVRIKILNEAGRDAGNVSFETSKAVRLSKIEGRTILPSGVIIPLDPSQVHRGKTYQSANGFAIIKTSFAFPSVEPGAIVEYQTVQSKDGFSFPPWIFDEPDLATLSSTLKVLVAPPLALAQFPVETTRKKIKVHETRTVQGDNLDYAVENLDPVRREPYALPFRNQAAMVIFTPYEFGYGVGSQPIIKTWDNVAERMNTEYRSASLKSKETKAKAREIAGKISSERGKAEALYQFLQRNVVSSAVVGVGTDRSVDEVLAAKRGDPDEINMLFVTMLREVKVDADLVLISARNWQTLIGRFPNVSQFSGVITCLNFSQGPIFADPADAAASFGNLPWFEQGVRGVLVKGNKAQEAVIPVSAPEDNITETKLSSEVKPGWKVESALEITMRGSPAEKVRRDLLEEAPEKLDQRLTSLLAKDLREALVGNVGHPDFRDPSQVLSLKAGVQHELTEEGGPGERLLNPWVADRYESPLFKATQRYSGVVFEFPEKRTSASSWRLHPGLEVEQLPKEVHLVNEVGEFAHSCTQQADVVSCTRTFSLKKLVLQSMDEYRSAKKFFEDVAHYDQEVMVLHEK